MAQLQKATFGMGCFWQPDLIYSKVKGIKSVEVGYMGGKIKNPSYMLVCTGMTGHAEVVHIKFEPKKVSYNKLLDIFWKRHDPTQLNKQGQDIGSQYRTVIFYHSTEQKKKALASLEKMQKELNGKVMTEIKKALTFYKAEKYHQKYLEKHGQKTC